jgi:signal transduction histidine kinase
VPLRSLLIAFCLAILCFISSTLYSQRSSRAIDRRAQSIATIAMPSIKRLSAARGDLRGLRVGLERYARSPQVELRRELDAARARIDNEVQAYLLLPVYPGELELQQELHKALVHVDRDVDTLLTRAEQGTIASPLDAVAPSEASLDRASRSLGGMIEFHARNATDDAAHIEMARLRADRIELLLDGISALLTLVVAWLAVRTLRHYDRVAQERNRLIATRAAELEMFAGRVAHDVLGPLSATSVAIQLVRRKIGEEALRTTLDRGMRGLTRVQTIVDGLLRFARAGAQPEPGVRTRLQPVVADLMAELTPLAAETDVTLVAERIDDVSVAANAGVLTSLLENLVRNAVKYMLNARERRVMVRAMRIDGRVRVEVQDTGPGIDPELRKNIFEPYVRGRDTGRPGIGLGLATVRRIVEAHAGVVGVDSSASGSVFWFELPRAADHEAEAQAPALH